MQVIDAMSTTLGSLANELQDKLGTNVLSISGPIQPGLDNQVRDAVELFPTLRDGVAVLVHTPGGVVEIVERIVHVLRHHWKEVTFVIPDLALSAGTVLAMSGDRIVMDYFAVLGPIDPQVPRQGKLVPALSYLTQYERILERFAAGVGTTAELALLNQLDLAELHQFEEARRLSVELLVNWLAAYKFKDWDVTETRRQPVSDAMKRDRAQEIAQRLSDHERWHSHGRGISRDTLRGELNLRIDRLEDEGPDTLKMVRDYHRFQMDLMQRENLPSFVHTQYYF